MNNPPPPLLQQSKQHDGQKILKTEEQEHKNCGQKEAGVLGAVDLTRVLPTELLERIFALVPPDAAIGLRRVNRTLRRVLGTAAFAMLNLATHLPDDDFEVPGSGGGVGCAPLGFTLGPNESDAPDAFDRGFFVWPAEYQAALAVLKYARLECVDWAVGSVRKPSKNKTRVCLRGKLPSAIGRAFANAYYIILSDNLLSGPIPPEISLCSKALVIELSLNSLSGHIPREISLCRNLARLSLSGNSLSGPIPPEICTLVDLEDLYLGFNDLSGPIPEDIGSLTKLKKLDLTKNNLSGHLPDSITRLVELERLNIPGNKLTGEIPADISKMVALRHVDLSANMFQGQLPISINQIHELNTLYVTGNNLTIPVEVRPFLETIKFLE
ncbi:hypothetical protein HK100_006976 [Physocladia obscura]|uniref:F-box domain-containing protein n=1 Tax=Physocladia obscura TaxID=109957 RepID=A0AAD5SPZ8_9FUNG|nr:hypothetical protein HK100_006976 [Physocladia obscura]